MMKVLVVLMMKVALVFVMMKVLFEFVVLFEGEKSFFLFQFFPFSFIKNINNFIY